MKKIKSMRLLLTAFVLTCLCGLTALAAPAIKSIEYKAGGRVEVEFAGKVRYKNMKVKATDSRGNKVKVAIVERDSDEVEFRLRKFKQGKTYKFTISGVRKRSEKSYSKVKGSVWIPKKDGNVAVKEIEYDGEDRDVSFDFANFVDWKNPVVKITHGKTNYVIRVLEADEDDMNVKVKKLKKGRIYQYRISGIRKAGDARFITISGSFMA